MNKCAFTTVFHYFSRVLQLLLSDPFRGMEAWQKTMDLQKSGNSPGSGLEIVERELPKSERRRVRSWTVQNEMRGVLRRVSAGAARRIFDSANPSVIRTKKKAVCVAA